MKISVISKLMVSMAVLSVFVPAALADHDNHDGYHDSGKHHGYDDHDNNGRYSNPAVYNSRHSKVVHYSKYNNGNGQKNDGNLGWEKHNWNDQRAQLRANWQRNEDIRISAAQQQLLDDQMKAQWNQYHNNKWNGQYSWSQYNDPKFLDYVHTNNPSLLTTLRTRFGF